MATTQIIDMEFGRPFTDTFVQRTMEMSDFFKSGIITTDPLITAVANGAGDMFNLPFTNPLTGTSVVMTDSGEVPTGKVTSNKDRAVRCNRHYSFEAHQLAGALAKFDPLDAVNMQIAEWRVGEDQAQLIATLNGIFSGPLASSHVLDVTSTSTALDADVVIDGLALLGSSAKYLSVIAMHSAKLFALRKQKLIAEKDLSAGIMFPKFMGLDVVVDDTLLPVGGNYPIYIFAKGAVSYANINVEYGFEPYREAKKAVDGLIHRWANIMHVRGVSYNEAAGENPANDVLDNGASWTKVYQDKAIRVVKLITK